MKDMILKCPYWVVQFEWSCSVGHLLAGELQDAMSIVGSSTYPAPATKKIHNNTKV